MEIKISESAFKEASLRLQIETLSHSLAVEEVFGHLLVTKREISGAVLTELLK